MGWIKDGVFANADEFIVWLEANYSDYIIKHINELHVHHTYLPNHASYNKYNTLQLHKNMRSHHVNSNGWDDIAQNITIGKDGDIVTGRDISLIPISAKNYNGTSGWHPFAFEMIGNFDAGNDKLQGKQLETAAKIAKYFIQKGKGVKFHRELLLNGKAPKTCPGTGVDKGWFMGVANSMNINTSPKPQQPTPQPLNPSVVYSAHGAGYGWQSEMKDGQEAGTTGKSLRMEALAIRLENTDANIFFKGHIQGRGWTELRGNGEIIGTVGLGLRLEALKISCDKHDVHYRVHLEGTGWQEWKKNDEIAGTVGEARRIEAIEIKLG